jgi:tetratricopeptide (TPR) repeat protein
MRLALVLAVVALVAGCASARVRRETVNGLRDADALAARGCHACLVDALAIYQRLSPRDATRRSLVARRVFRTSLLLALRAKELGLDPRPHLERARASTPSPASADHERLELADRLPSNPAALTREASLQQGQRLMAANDRLVARLARPRLSSDDPELDAYLDLSILCLGRVRLEPPRPAASLLPPGAPSPLLHYRLGACGIAEESHLETALAAEPRFVETALFVGRYRLLAPRGGTAPGPQGRAAREALQRAHDAFPASTAITMELASALRTFAFYREALPLFNQVLIEAPGHHDAWYGRGLCESYLRRHDAAVTSMTRLLELGQWLTADALYWRAWNRHQLRQLDASWDDVVRAKTMLYSTEVFALSGIIAHDRQQFDVARPDLQRALEINPRNCTAGWYLGLTDAAQERWPASGAAFERAAACYRLDAEDARQSLARAETLEESDGRTEQIASARAAIEESQRQEALSAYNAGYGLVRAQDAIRARAFLERARQHADVRARADELLTWIDRPARELD